MFKELWNRDCIEKSFENQTYKKNCIQTLLKSIKIRKSLIRELISIIKNCLIKMRQIKCKRNIIKNDVWSINL